MKKKPPRSVPPRDDFYMGMAIWYASKSKDPDTQVGAVIISQNNEPLGWGYNGPPASINDEEINWERPDKYDYVAHAEENAIEYSHGDLTTSTLYVSAKPCKKCALLIARKKIKRIVYFPYKSTDKNSLFASETVMEKTDEILRLAKVHLEEYKGNLNWMRDRAEWMKTAGIFQ